MFPFLLIALGIVVLAFGSRLAILGAAVGALLGVALLRLLPGESNIWLTLLIPAGLAVLFFFGAGLAKGAVSLITLVLGILADAPDPLAPNEIAERLIISRATVTGLLDSLETRAYVRRTPHPTDRRMLLIELTESGRAAAVFSNGVGCWLCAWQPPQLLRISPGRS